MVKDKRITYTTIIARGACLEKAEKFLDLFPEGVVPTLELCRKHAGDLDFFWAGRHLVPVRYREVFMSKRVVYSLKYNRIVDQNFSTFRRDKDRAKYENAVKAALDDYHLDQAVAFWETWTEANGGES